MAAVLDRPWKSEPEAALDAFEVWAAAVGLVTVTVVTLPPTVLVTTESRPEVMSDGLDETPDCAETKVVRFVAAAVAEEVEEGRSVKLVKMAGPGPFGKLFGSNGVPPPPPPPPLAVPLDDAPDGGRLDGTEVGSGRMVGNVSRFETAREASVCQRTLSPPAAGRHDLAGISSAMIFRDVGGATAAEGAAGLT